MAEVFVSWTRADGDDDPCRFAQSLRSAGLSVWLDEDRIAAFETIPDSVWEGLSGAKVLVVWYSATYTSRRACREELTLALLAAERVSEGEKRVLWSTLRKASITWSKPDCLTVDLQVAKTSTIWMPWRHR